MLGRLNINPENDYRFLGDAVFDTRYVANAVLNQTSNRYLNGVGSDLEQMRYLMGNAASTQSSLGLKFGVSLNADQIASLDHSILWWESATVNGETVMIPKVYLSSKDVTVNNGSVIAGNNVDITGGNVTSDGSTLLAKNALAIDSAGEISNTNNALIKAGRDVDLHAAGDINNISAAIAGNAVDIDSVSGSINNQTLTEQFSLDARDRFGSVSLKETLTGSTATISAAEDLSLTAGKDITLTGASLKAGGDLLMDAEGNIAVNAIEMNKAYAQSGFWQRAANSQAASLAAGEQADLQAGRDVNLLAEATRWGNSSREKKHTLINDHVRQQGTEIASGGDTVIIAGRDMNAEASQVMAQKDIGVQAGRNINLTTATESDYHYEEKTKTKKKFPEKNHYPHHHGTARHA